MDICHKHKTNILSNFIEKDQSWKWHVDMNRTNSTIYFWKSCFYIKLFNDKLGDANSLAIASKTRFLIIVLQQTSDK